MCQNILKLFKVLYCQFVVNGEATKFVDNEIVLIHIKKEVRIIVILIYIIWSSSDDKGHEAVRET